jgi:hypothetical protein
VRQKRKVIVDCRLPSADLAQELSDKDSDFDSNPQSTNAIDSAQRSLDTSLLDRIIRNA